MFIRKTKKTVSETNKDYFVYQLVESIRTEKGPRQRILLSLGSDLGLSDEDIKILAGRIEEIFQGINSLFTCSEKIETLAQKFASQLIHRLSNEKETCEEHKKDLQTIDINTIEQQEPRTVGIEHLLLHFASKLQIQKKLKELGLSEKEVILSLATIIGRAAFPSSERALHKWVTQRSGLGELLDFDFQKISLHNFYQISDVLLKHKIELEKYLEQAQMKIHGYQSTMVLYDLTNTYMEGQAKSNPKAAHGYSKEKRSDCRLITLGLVINEHGFISRSSILPGNISECDTFQKMIESLSYFEKILKPTVIIDAGIATEDNLLWLRNNNYTYVVSSRQNAPSMELEGPLLPVGDPNKTHVKAALVKTDGDEEKWLYCESKAKQAVALQMKEFFQKRFETDLKKVAESLSKPKGRKKHPIILERIGKLKEKHKRISGCYEIDIKTTSDEKIVTAIHWTLKPEKLEKKLNGRYFLRTNLTRLSAEELWNLYDSIRTVEDTFRFMKSSLGLRPVYHQKERRVDGHLWITTLAYHLIQSCMYQLKQQGICYRWETIRDLMSTRIRVTIKADIENEKILYHRSTTKAEEHQKKIYQALGITSQILKARKTIV